VVRSTLAPKLACSAWETCVCPEGDCLYLHKLNIACEISSFPLSLTVLRLAQLRWLSNEALGRAANDLDRWAVLDQL